MELALLWVLSLVGVFLVQIKDPAIVDRFSNSSIGLFFENEWWRPFTALFLHADFPHLAGNVMIGGVFCVLVAQSFGQLRGWLLILASGVMGECHHGLGALSGGVSLDRGVDGDLWCAWPVSGNGDRAVLEFAQLS